MDRACHGLDHTTVIHQQKFKLIENMFTGEFDIEVKGRKRSLKWGTLSFALFCESEGIELNEIKQRLEDPKPFTQINLIHSAAVAHCRINKKEIDFSIDQVSEWIDEIGEHVLAELIVKAMKARLEKNLKAPVKTGRKKVSGDGMKQ